MLISWDDRYLHDVIDLWNAEAVKDGYKEMTEESFARTFTGHPNFDPEAAFLLVEDGRAVGFACGCTGDELPLGDVAGYITCIVLAGDRRTDDRYNEMLGALENRFRELGKKQAEVLFFNPMMLPWYIPNTPKHEHNNAPGVPVESDLYRFLLRAGYTDRARQHAMYLPLAGFRVPEEIRDKEAKALSEGYSVELYDAGKVVGVEVMLEALGNPLWKREISQSTASGVPVVMASCRGAAAGFAGPVIRQENGRGYFAGIGVHPDHEGHGLGSILFNKLCEAFRNIGTEYMSLYTGYNNPALRIYEKAGFQKVKEFAVMRRELDV
ncbi:GNAT family N-acetyltransferase [Cohnella pontilimi]|uniref:GNAT family N-acetyltransferase n=1 Tax=Cohnella pontilimi TaxID=2564100 RepID=A0A4V5LS99_9BACL|nr:GNAT family N-acetyltransferase [Cohnella pontilimi]TJY42299.1 GNAT family N-acetyltransferase [Cohnella pontilimi]